MRNLILVGPMGSGKTTIGRLLSKELKLLFKDTDQEIEQKTGVSISFIFDVEGEEGFRAREQAVIAELAKLQGVVIATGGGAVLRQTNRDCMRSSGVVIYLHASIEQQVFRTARDRNRPLLRTADSSAVLTNLMKVREPLYREVATLVVETDQRPQRFVVREILALLEKQPISTLEC